MKSILYLVTLIALIGAAFYWYQSSQNESAHNTPDESVTAEQKENEIGSPEESPTFSTTRDNDAPDDAKVFDLQGKNYEFDTKTITVTEGDTVTVNLTSSEGFHDWAVDEFDAATDKVQTGQSASVTFVADRAGTYEYYCSVGSHRELGMVGTLVVEAEPS